MSQCLPRILVLIPKGAEGVASLVAAGRSGALGMLDLDHSQADARRKALDAAQCWTDRPFAIRVDPEGIDPEEWPRSLGVVACVGDRSTDWRGLVRSIHDSGRIALAEVVDREAARAATEAGADGLIVSGLEAGGRCGEESSFILLQAVLADGASSCWVRGGIGPDSAAVCVGAGATGVVLDGAVLLARESPLEQSDRARVARLDGGETLAIGPEGGPMVRVDALPGSSAVARLKQAAEPGSPGWRQAIDQDMGWGPGQARPIGQDGAFAKALAHQWVTVGGIVQAVSKGIDEGKNLAASARPLAPGSPMARSLGTRYPIVQGPMTRVSDSAAFANAVAQGGALPMLALAMLRGAESTALLEETARTLDGKPWGVGVLGFVDPTLRAEQLEAIRAVRPPFALIAGGRPDQAEELEQLGIRTFLHAPSPGLLSQYLRAGARRFVLEGRECGGHVGPRSSLVLWEQAVAEIREGIDRGQIRDPEALHLLFAGGVHDARSAAGVAAMASPLADRGVKIGLLVGTAYVFTKEAVDTGAIVPRFQVEAVGCRSTVLLPTGPGHEVRAVPSPYTEQFVEERRRLLAAGAPHSEVQEALERLNVGRLRVATKGLDRPDGSGAKLEVLGEAEQYDRGLYMIGQVATLRDSVTTIEELHEELSVRSTACFDRPEIESVVEKTSHPSDVAIVGMAAVMPGAGDVRTFWENTLKGLDAIVEVPSDRWDWRPYYDPDGKAPDKIISKWGGFLPDVPFDPLRYGMPPTSLPSIEPAQLLVLETVRAALDDAGYSDRPFPKERTAVVLGMGGGAAQLAMGYAFRSYLPMLESVAPEAGREAREQAERYLPEWTEDAFPGFLLNVTAGRVANRFDLGGANYTVDAACGSSLAAASLAVRELETGAADMVILGGADTVQNPFTYLAFSKTHAFSPRGRCRPFDASADGIVISEGVGVVVLKRLADAERDGDRIYAVIKGLGSSSDGRDRGLTAPNGDGQARALARAYAKAGVSPRSVGYVEAHGTGTAVGDVVEVNALSTFFKGDGAAQASCAVGSVKSMIGHTKCAAGLAGLISASLSLYHKVLPPTIGVERLNPAADLKDGPLRVSTALRPWLHSDDQTPRRAGVSAFGFGGTNFHAVLEAYESDPAPRPDPIRDWPAELLVWRAEDRGALQARIARLSAAIDEGARPDLRDLSHTLIRQYDREPCQQTTLAIVAKSVEHLRELLSSAQEAIERGDRSLQDPRGIFFEERPGFGSESVAFLFPGQGAQRLEMLLDLTLAFDEVRGGYEAFDAALIASGKSPIGPQVFPPTTLDEAERERARLALTATNVAQPAVGAASVGLLRFFEAIGVRPDAVAGHSYGELVAFHAAGALGVESLAELSEARGRLMIEAAGPDPGGMTALSCDFKKAAELIDGVDGVVLANRNGPGQTVIAGRRDAMNRVIDQARSQGVRTFDLPVGAAFHSPIVAGARGPMTQLTSSLMTGSPKLPVYSNLDAAVHPGEPGRIARRLGDHLASPVQFSTMIEAMYDDGVRVFLECGPGSILGPLVGSILGDRPHLAVSCETPGKPGLPALLTAIARLLVSGVAIPGLARLTERRGARLLDLDRLSAEIDQRPASTWLVNGSRARPMNGPEPERLGMCLEKTSQNGLSRENEMSARPSPRSSSAAEATAPPRTNHFEADSDRRASDATGAADSGGDARRASATRSSRAPSGLNNPGNAKGASERNGVSASSRHRSSHRDEPSGSSDLTGADRVMESFQETMRTFLEVQQATMAAYLKGRTPQAHSRQEQSSPSAPRETSSRDELAYLNGVGGAEVSELEAPPAHDGLNGALREARDGGQEHSNKGNRPQSRLHSLNSAHEAHPIEVEHPKQATREPAGSASGAGSIGQDGLDRGSIATRLIEIVRDRTGYPAEMLELGLDLEADLGIDSIKRVEILGTLRESIDGLRSQTNSKLMDGLSRSKTLGEIVDQVVSALSKPSSLEKRTDQDTRRGSVSNGGVDQPGSGRQSPSRSKREKNGKDAHVFPSHPRINGGKRLRRRILESVEAPPQTLPSGLDPQGVVIVTDDGRGIARTIAEQLRTEGLRVELAGRDWTDFTSPAAVTRKVEQLRVQAPLAGIIHAQPVGDVLESTLEPTVWAGRLDQSLRGLFLLARAASEDLERSARQGGACLIAATAMGGTFASTGSPINQFFPGHGGVSGLVKTLAREWPGVRTRVVDLDPGEPVDILAAQLMAEALLDDGWPEVGYLDRRRVRLRTRERPLELSRPAFKIQPHEPILITGGARGISASVAIEIARRWKPTLLLIGSSPYPSQAESEETEGIDTPWALKAMLLERSRREGRAVGPSELEQSYRALVRSREIRRSIARMRAEGAVVEYAQVDVRDANSVSRTLDRWRDTYGEPVGLIHGAGVIHDKLLRDKTPESFDRVLGTKIDGALNLARALRGDRLRFTALFSSIAGRFGNQGQSDYAAANEILNKLALLLDREWPGRVVSINWGPWSGVGMVSDLQDHLGRRGLGMIDPGVGCEALVDELLYGRKGEVEVLLADDLGTLEGPLSSPELRLVGASR